ncbi:2Fe-2S iron-sulfur cluster-binding protein [Colwellia sp. E150_009]
MRSITNTFYDLTVSTIVKETTESVTAFFRLPKLLVNDFKWQPGQYVKVEICLNGVTYLRNYSISAPKNANELSITIKRLPGGLVSTYLTTQLKLGDVIRMTCPIGNFTLTPKSNNAKSYVFVCAGSGITPVFSMISSVLAEEESSCVYLLYGNRNAKSSIFRKALLHLQQKYNDKIVVCHCYSTPTWFGIFSTGRKGRINAETIKHFLTMNAVALQSAEYYVCGPGSFIPMVKTTLNLLDIKECNIHVETFGAKEKLLISQKKHEVVKLTVQLTGKTHQVVTNESEYLLSSLKRSSISAPYSCENGTCGTCKCQLLAGEVEMEENYYLTQQEVQQGFILACQSIPKTDEVAISFPD